MSEPFIGQIVMFGGNFAPRGWAFCDGQLLSIAQNQALFAILGTTYGGDGRTTFALPDLRGRVPLGPRNGPGLSPYREGQKGGAENVTLNVTQIPSHNHNVQLQGENRPGNTDDPTGNMPAKLTGAYRPQAPSDDVLFNDAAIVETNIGGGQSHTNMQPYLAVNYIIALQGVFPSRS